MKSIEMRASDFKRELIPYSFPETMKQDFYNYWTEANASKTKMRFEQEKTWDLSRRLSRWANNNKEKFNLQKTESGFRQPKIIKEPETELEKLDHTLRMYQEKFESVPFLDMGKWYDFLKKERLMKVITKEDIEILREAYGDDNYKCRCGCVQWTFDSMTNMGKDFAWLYNVVNRFQ